VENIVMVAMDDMEDTGVTDDMVDMDVTAGMAGTVDIADIVVMAIVIRHTTTVGMVAVDVGRHSTTLHRTHQTRNSMMDPKS